MLLLLDLLAGEVLDLDDVELRAPDVARNLGLDLLRAGIVPQREGLNSVMVSSKLGQ